MSERSEDEGYLAALAGFRGMGPGRLRLLLMHHAPAEAYAVAAGRAAPHPMVARMLTTELRRTWAIDAGERVPAEHGARCRSAGITVIPYGDRRYPPVLLDDPRPPTLLFVRGDLGALDVRRVGIVGTRNATRAGLALAFELGAELAAAGVTVVSGLARGIDGAAHRGALSTPGGRTVGVVANGLDRPYPSSNRQLWGAVADVGAVLGEWPLGTRPEPFRFPMRNRILAALSEVVIVVESRERGGSLVTAREAIERGIDVMAVPGSPRNRSSCGTNGLIRDGAAPVTDVGDVLVALGLDTTRSERRRFDSRPVPRGVEADVLHACSATARTLDEVATMLALPLPTAAMALARLERAGWLAEAGGWFEPTTWPMASDSL